MANESKIQTELKVDDPKNLPSGYTFDANDRRYMDNQIRETQRHIVTSLLNGAHTSWPYLSSSSAAVIEGDVVCSAADSDIDGIPVVTKALSGAISDAKAVYGIVVTGGSPNTRIQIAFSGVLPASITGLDEDDPGAVRLNTSTARCQKVTSFSETDYPIGTVNTKGNLTITTLPLGSVLGIGSGGGGSTLYTLSGSSASLVSGDWVCLVPGDTTITKAVPAALLLAGCAFGIVGTSWSPGANDVIVYTAGDEVPHTVTGLGASVDGNPHDVGITSGARSQYLYNPSGAEFVGGYAASNGRLTIAPKAANATSPSHVFNPLTFGAVGDGVTDDLPAFDAMRDYMRELAVQLGVGGTTSIYEVELPAGRNFYLSDTWIVASSMRLRQRGGGSYNASGKIISAPGKSGIWSENGVLAPLVYGADGSSSDLGHLTVWSQPLVRYRDSGEGLGLGIGPALRQTTTAYVKGNCVVAGTSFPAGTNPDVFFRARTTGTTSATAYGSLTGTGGRTLSTAIPGDVFTDGGVTWDCEAFVFPRKLARGGGSKTTYAVGERYMNYGPHRVPLYNGTSPMGPDEDALAGEDDCRWYFQCAIAGTINATPGNVRGPTGPSLLQAVRANYDGQAGVYSEGDIVTGGIDGINIDPSNNKRYQAQNSGNAGASAPTYNNTPGATFTDGAITWKTLDVPTDGTTGAFPMYFTDGSAAAGAVFAVRIHAGIIASGSFTQVHDCYVRGFTNAAVHGEGTTPTSFDNGKIVNIITVSNGLGVYIGTSEANGCRIRGIDCIKSADTLQKLESLDGSTGTRNYGGATVWNHGQGPASVSDAYGQNSWGRNIFDHCPAGSSVYSGCNSENGRGDRSISGGITIGGSQASSISAAAFGAWTVIGPSGGNGFNFDLFDSVSKTRLTIQPKNSGTLAHTVFNLRNTDTAVEAGSEGFRFGYEDLALGVDTGYWDWPGYGTQNPMCVGGFTGAQADAGPGHAWLEHGMVLGRIGLAKGFWGLVTESSQTSKTSKQVFEGVRKRGFKFEYWDRGQTGKWRYEFVDTDAADAPARQNNASAFVEGSPHGYAATTCKSPNGLYIYRCTTGGTTHSSAPAGLDAGSSPVSEGSGTVVWTLIGSTATYNVSGLIEDPKVGLVPHVTCDWADTAGTESTTVQPKAKVRSRRKQVQTTTNGAGQVLDDGTTLANQDLTFIEGELREIDVLLLGKRNGSSEATVIKLSGVYYYEGGTMVNVGTDDNTTKETGAQITGTTADLSISGATVRVRVTPANNITIDWTVIRQDTIRLE